MLEQNGVLANGVLTEILTRITSSLWSTAAAA